MLCFDRTLTHCDLLGLKKVDLDLVLETYPHLKEQVIQIAYATASGLRITKQTNGEDDVEQVGCLRVF